ncbi:MAG: PQQ-dependent sugar dehydrogenase [Ferruginibacter sp.]
MKRIVIQLVFALLFCSNSFAQGETFSSKRVVNANTVSGRLRHPFAMVLGPDDSLWITERRGYVIRMNRTDGVKTELLNIRSLVKFTSGTSSIKQDGMFGIALHPELNQNKGNDFVYLAYCYDSSGFRRVKIVRYNYNRNIPSLSGEVTLVKGIYGSDDHNGGKLVIGNFGTAIAPDYKLMYSVGDKGSNQFANACDSIESQYIPTTAQVIANDGHRYNGKILRINLDGTIPADNPDFSGIGRSHVWSYGHRNPQGLAFERDNNNVLVPDGKLYESEQGPASNDEVNIISMGRNYGWPRVSGKRDNNWYKYYQWSNNGSCNSYPGECSGTQTSSGIIETSFPFAQHTNPIFDLYPGTPAGGTGCNWLTNPTLAPASIIHYPFSNKIPGWQNSLLISTLKSSAVYRLKLNPTGDNSLSVSDSVVEYFHNSSALNRYRDIVVANDGISFYLLTDSVGSTSGPTAGVDGGVTNRGAVVEYIYTGLILSIDEITVRPTDPKVFIKVFPNPASDLLFIESKRNVPKPIYYQIFDVAGRMVLSGNSNKDKFDIPVSQLSKGIYSLKLYNGRDIKLAVQKVVIN